MMSLLTKLSASIICLSPSLSSLSVKSLQAWSSLPFLFWSHPVCWFVYVLLKKNYRDQSDKRQTENQSERWRNGGQKRERWKEISLCSWQRRFVTCRTAVFIGVFLESRDCAKMEIRQKSPKDLNGETDKAEKLIFPIHYYGNCPTCLFWESKITGSGGLAIWSARSFPDGPLYNGGRPFA